MRIARFSAEATGGGPQYGVVTGEVDEQGEPAEDSVILALSGDPLYVGIKPTDTQLALADVRLLAPVIPRSKIVAVGRNYAAHAAEMGSEVPDEPMVFLKPNTSVIGPGDAIHYPPQTGDLHYEGELAVVIGRICRDIPAEQARDVIFGYTAANDVTARDLQRKDGRYSRAKGFDTFCPVGPWIEIDLDPRDFSEGRRVRTYLDGDVVQEGTTADMVFDIPTLIAHISAMMTLLPGDLILTGTPEGVGPMQVDQEVEVVIDGIGGLANSVVTKP